MATRSEDIVSEAPCKMHGLHKGVHGDGIKHSQFTVTIGPFFVTLVR